MKTRLRAGPGGHACPATVSALAFVALICAAQPAAQAATVGWWRFEGTGAAFTADSGPNALALSNAGVVPVAQPGFDNPLPQTGQSNETAAALDGADRFTAPPGAAAAAPRFTVETYVRLDALPSATQFLAGIFRSDNSNRRWALVVVSGGGLSLYLSSDGVANETVSSGLTLTTNRSYYVAAALDAAETGASTGPCCRSTSEPSRRCRVHDYMAEGLLVYLKDLAFDDSGRPVILYLTSTGYMPGPAGDPRTLRTARWDGASWIIRDVVATDHNYDYGSLSIDAEGTWRIVGTFLPGPQVYGTGGEVGIWTSADHGASWKLDRALTSGSTLNHNYPRRPVDAHDDFFSMWADGDAFAPSASSLYFTDRHGDAVYRLPGVMTNESAYPEVVAVADPGGDPDGDGVPTGDELRAGTHPRRANSALRMGYPGPPSPAGNTVVFTTATAMQYRVEVSTNLSLGQWDELPGAVEGTGGSVLVTDPAASGSTPLFYRVRLVEP